MEHVAIDLGSRESQVCVRNARGEILLERKVPTARLPAYLAKRPRSRVIVETCAEAFFVADAASAAGHEVRVVPASLVRQLGVGERGVKNDQRDARKLSEVSTRIDLPSVHVPSELSRERKCVFRRTRSPIPALPDHPFRRIRSPDRSEIREPFWQSRSHALPNCDTCFLRNPKGWCDIQCW